MPTKRPRHLIVETDPITRALGQAAKRWPDERSRPSRLLIHLIEKGEQALTHDETAADAGVVNAVAKTRGVLTGVYGPGYLDQLRGDWPA
jgi:hypothetical protein